MNDSLLTFEATSHYLSINVATLRRYVFENKIPFVKIGKLVRFRKSDLDKFVSANLREVRMK